VGLHAVRGLIHGVIETPENLPVKVLTPLVNGLFITLIKAMK
jgi:hypothetical protein